MTLTNDVAELSGVVNLTSSDVTLDTDGRDCSFKVEFALDCSEYAIENYNHQVRLLRH